jgi:hypothetical protein
MPSRGSCESGDRDLAAAVGNVDREGRHGVAGRVARSASMISKPLVTAVRK